MREKLSERLNWEQAVAILECSRSHFYRLVQSGQIPCNSKIGKRRGIKVLRSDVEAYLSRGKKQQN